MQVEWGLRRHDEASFKAAFGVNSPGAQKETSYRSNIQETLE